VSIFLIDVYTRENEGREVEVPNLVGIPILSLIEKQADIPIRFRILDSVYIADHKPGEVIRQHPSATYLDPVDQTVKKRRVKREKVIELVINRFYPPIVEMFNYYARPAKEVRILLRELSIPVAQELKINAGVCPDCVVQITDAQGRNIDVGDKIREGQEVVMLIDAAGLRENKLVDVPLLEGLTIAQAQEIIRQAKLNLGSIVGSKGAADYKESSIIKSQSPHPKNRKQVGIGSYINLVIKE